VQRFGSKRGLLVAFCRRAAANASTPFEAAGKTELSPLRALRRALRASVESLTSRAALVNSLALLLEDVRDDELRAAAAEHARKTQEHIRLLVAAAVDAGELDVRDPGRHAAAIQAARDGALVQWALRGEGPLGDWVVDRLAPLLSGPGGGRRRARAQPSSRGSCP
jgi:AcrR family transcriptional regulator